MVVASLGPNKSYTAMAAERLFPGGTHHLCRTPFEVLEMVQDGRARRGVLPIENSTAGPVVDTIQMLAEQRAGAPAAFIVDEHYERITHHLLTVDGHADPDIITRIVTNRWALKQCEHWMRKHLPNAEFEEIESTAAAAEHVANLREPSIVAIASAEAAKAFGLRIARRSINDLANNYTRFIVLSRNKSPIPPKTDARATLFTILQNRPGSLAETLQVIASQNLDISRISMVRATFPVAFEVLDWFMLDINLGQGGSDGLLEVMRGLQRTAAHVALKLGGIYIARDDLRPSAADDISGDDYGEDGDTEGEGDSNTGETTETETAKYKELILRGESERVEFKSSLRFDLQTKRSNRELEEAVVKTLAAFMNSWGGNLLIGVGDDGHILGIEADLASFQGANQHDRLRQHMATIVRRHLGGEVARLFSGTFLSIEDKLIYVVRVKRRARGPVFFTDKTDSEHFFIRSETSSLPLSRREAHEYIQEHWPEKDVNS